MDIRLTLLGSPALHAEVETPFGPERHFRLLAMLGLRRRVARARRDRGAGPSKATPRRGATCAR
ncbi:MAG: hypothetical protein U1F49_13940 [Rubrivivax sp.]